MYESVAHETAELEGAGAEDEGSAEDDGADDGPKDGSIEAEGAKVGPEEEMVDDAADAETVDDAVAELTTGLHDPTARVSQSGDAEAWLSAPVAVSYAQERYFVIV